MESKVTHQPLQPRILRYRSQYKYYLYSFLSVGLMIISFWSYRVFDLGFNHAWELNHFEMKLSFLYFVGITTFYFFWLRNRLHRSVQVFSDHIFLKSPKTQVKIQIADIDSVSVVCWSIFYCKLKDGSKYYFSSSLERVDYVWEGLFKARPELFQQHEYESYRLQLIQYDHHQKRKEWFFRHKLIDVFNWIVIPCSFILAACVIQSGTFQIHQQGMYFFRLIMYSLMVILACTFFYSYALKKFVFDKRVKMSLPGEEKIRDLEFEGVVLHRSKIFQLLTVMILFGGIIKADLNMYSLTKIHENIASFKFKKGDTLIVDNRFNCVSCEYAVQEGDIIVFGKGTLGQIIAKEGEMIGQFYENKSGRHIASESVTDVPAKHVAVKLANQKDIVMVKETDLLGRIQK